MAREIKKVFCMEEKTCYSELELATYRKDWRMNGRIFGDFSSWLHSAEKMYVIEQTLDDTLRAIKAEKQGVTDLNFRLKAVEIGLAAIKGGELYFGRDDGILVSGDEMRRRVLFLALQRVPEGGTEVGDRLAALALDNVKRTNPMPDMEDFWQKSSPGQLLKTALEKARPGAPVKRDLEAERRRMENRGLGLSERLARFLRPAPSPV